MKCDFPDCEMPATRRRQRTSYVDDEMNFAILCEEHHKENDEYWYEMWEEYYRGCL